MTSHKTPESSPVPSLSQKMKTSISIPKLAFKEKDTSMLSDNSSDGSAPPLKRDENASIFSRIGKTGSIGKNQLGQIMARMNFL